MNQARQPRLVYFGDAMCSWCYGFAPVIAALRAAHPDLAIELINGGLRPGNTKPMTQNDKSMIRSHWEHVQQASGQAFDFGLFDREGFIYDTEPAARAVVLIRNRAPQQALDFFHALQSAFYAAGRDVTQAAVLADLAAGFGHDRAAFLAAFNDDESRTEAWTDFHIAQRTGVTGFPTLIAGTGAVDGWTLITQGYQPPDRVLSTVARWLGAIGGARTDA